MISPSIDFQRHTFIHVVLIRRIWGEVLLEIYKRHLMTSYLHPLLLSHLMTVALSKFHPGRVGRSGRHSFPQIHLMKSVVCWTNTDGDGSRGVRRRQQWQRLFDDGNFLPRSLSAHAVSFAGFQLTFASANSRRASFSFIDRFTTASPLPALKYGNFMVVII